MEECLHWTLQWGEQRVAAFIVIIHEAQSDTVLRFSTFTKNAGQTKITGVPEMVSLFIGTSNFIMN